MRASNVDRETLLRAAELVGVVADVHPLNKRGDRWNVKLFRDSAEARRTSANVREGRYQRYGRSRRADGSRRLTGAVCWHGFRDYLRAVFVVAPSARFTTAHARYDGAEHFERSYERTAERNVGSSADPAAFGDLCGCERDGGAELPPNGPRFPQCADKRAPLPTGASYRRSRSCAERNGAARLEGFGRAVVSILDRAEWNGDTNEAIGAAARECGIELREPDELAAPAQELPR